MRNEMSLIWRAGLATWLACALVVGCGGDDSEETAGSGGSSGSGGSEAGSGGTGGSDAGGSGGSGGSGGRGGSGGNGGMGGFTVMCTEPMQTSPITCGGTMCPIPEGILGMDACMRSCCVMNTEGEEVCGTKSTIEGMAGECGAPPPPDDRCPDYTDALGAMREGCCNDMNQCGAVSTLTNACVTESPLIMDLPMTPPACDAAGEDAGTE